MQAPSARGCRPGAMRAAGWVDEDGRSGLGVCAAEAFRSMSYERMQARELQLRTQIDELLARADVVEVDEDRAGYFRRAWETRQREVKLQGGHEPDDDEPPMPGQLARPAKSPGRSNAPLESPRLWPKTTSPIRTHAS